MAAPQREKLIYCVRHAQALHNVKEKEAVERAKLVYGEDHLAELERARKAVLQDESLRDAPLSTPGVCQIRKQSNLLRMLNKNAGYPSPKVVLVSPLRRTLMTATQLFMQADTKPRFIALEVLREKRTGFAADERTSVDELEKEFPHVDFSDLHVERPQIQPGEDNLAVRARTKVFLEGPLASSEEDVVAFVTHKGFLREMRQTLKGYIDEGLLKADFDLKMWYQLLYGNTEIRVVKTTWEGTQITSIVSRSVENALEEAQAQDEAICKELRGSVAGLEEVKSNDKTG
mmetsp:Transcript_15543/g.20235  ORF Transcript_15543/g.20235 Transcript_15543/m.20235 type:complete len:288 (+) Transcript_15543:82-945(+)|eukprot:CAMPEP_0198145198 /NCGR_PEP_ID=MMETSP1443-20131203/21793_1 /TAXON_ID=186043 /ORGANISM="Entomoneis sp., Strain CCMP2396" /LENGTH=287 /DNA_ID=CAMNT_0043808765 /DNA_START=34 /DNA_END=897 /DNA_ORIENTATION=+